MRAGTRLRTLVAPYCVNNLTEKNKKWKEHFKVITFMGKTAVAVKNARAFVKAVIEERGGQMPFITKIGLDSGKGRLTGTLVLQEKDIGAQKVSRNSYGGPAKSKSRAKSGGVNHTLTWLVAPGVKETNQSVHESLTMITLPEGNFAFTPDFKINALATKGSTNHACRYPCYGCYWQNGAADVACNRDLCEFKSPTDCKESQQRFKPCIYRTFRHNREHHAAWVADGAMPNRRKEFWSVEMPPAGIFDDFSDEFILHKVPLESLHLKLGLFTKCFTHLQTLFPAAALFPAALFVKQDHWGRWPGNEVDKILANLDLLEKMVEDNFLLLGHRARVVRVLEALRALKRLITACWRWEPTGFRLGAGGTDEQKAVPSDEEIDEMEEWRASIRWFKLSYLAARMSITTKAHTVFEHLEDLIAHSGHGLAPFNAQGAEHFHARLETFHQRHNVKDHNNPLYAEGLLAAVSEITALSV